MTYKDERALEQKLDEHRAWNTLELKIDSAADTISSQLLWAISTLRCEKTWCVSRHAPRTRAPPRASRSAGVPATRRPHGGRSAARGPLGVSRPRRL